MAFCAALATSGEVCERAVLASARSRCASAELSLRSAVALARSLAMAFWAF